MALEATGPGLSQDKKTDILDPARLATPANLNPTSIKRPTSGPAFVNNTIADGVALPSAANDGFPKKLLLFNPDEPPTLPANDEKSPQVIAEENRKATVDVAHRALTGEIDPNTLSTKVEGNLDEGSEETVRQVRDEQNQKKTAPAASDDDGDDDDGDNPGLKDDMKEALVVSGFLAGIVSAVSNYAKKWRLPRFRHKKHRLKKLWRLLAGKKRVVKVKDHKAIKAAGKEGEKAQKALREASTERELAEARLAKEKLAETGDVGKAERELAVATRVEATAAKEVTAATREMEEAAKLIKMIKRSRGGPAGGLITGAAVLPVLAAFAWVKTAKAGTSNQDLEQGAAKVAVSTFSFLNKDAIADWKDGHYLSAADEYFGVSDSIRLAKLAYNDPAAFKKEMSDMGEAATKLTDWAQKNPEKFNKLVEDPDRYIKDPEFMSAFGTTLHDGLSGDHGAAATDGLGALSRGLQIEENKKTSAIPTAPSPMRRATPIAGPVRSNRTPAQPDQQPTEG